MSNQIYYFKNFCKLPGGKKAKELEWYKLSWKEFVKLKNMLVAEFVDEYPLPIIKKDDKNIGG